MERNSQQDLEENLHGPEAAQEGTKAAFNVLKLGLINKKIPLKFCEFRVSNTPAKMITTESASISTQGIVFASPVRFGEGSLLRVWIEMPDYWARKSRHVGYRHTDAPTFFQILVRAVQIQEQNKRNNRYLLTCQTLNLDAVDEVVLHDYLGTGGISSP